MKAHIGGEGQAGRPRTAEQRDKNRKFGAVRAKVEHLFRIVKCQFGYRKVRYRIIRKNAAQVFALLALANLYLVRSRIASALREEAVKDAFTPLLESNSSENGLDTQR